MQSVRSSSHRLSRFLSSFRRAGAYACVSSLLCIASAGSAAATDLKIDPGLERAAQRDLGLSSTQIRQWLLIQRDAPAKAALAQRRLGAHYAGSWIERGDHDGVRLIVASSDPRASLKLDGVELRNVRYSLSELEAAKARLDHIARTRVAGISRPIDGVHAWHVDPASNSVVVSVAPEAMDRAVDFAAVSGAGVGALRFQAVPGVPQPTAQVYGGLGYQKNGAPSCSVGFAAMQGATKGFVSAGHCGTTGQSIGFNGATAGYISGSEFPGHDRAWVVVYANNELFPLVTNHVGGFVQVRGSLEAFQSAVVCRSGWKTGYQCGYITAKLVTVNSTGGMVFGLTQTNACAGFGDSGGGWIDAFGQAQGVTSAGNIQVGAENNCGLPHVLTWYYPLNPILQRYGLSLVTL